LQESNVLARRAAAGAEKSSPEPGHASLAGLAGRQLAAGTRRPVPAHKSIAVARSGTTTRPRPSFRADSLRAPVGRGT